MFVVAANNALTPSPVAYDATGGGAALRDQTVSPLSTTWSHTAQAGADVFAWVYAQQNAQNGISSIAATYGGTAMTLLSSVKLGNTNYGTLALFRLANVAGGAQTVSATATAPSGGISNLIGNSESILNVGTVGTITTNFGLAASVSVAATGVAQGVVINAFVAASTTGTVTLSSYNGTQRYMTAATDSPLVMGDTSTIGSFSFTASISGSFNWCGIAAVLTP